MHRYWQERTEAEKMNATDNRLLALQEEIEFLRELLESLNLERRYQKQELQETEQELQKTKQELQKMNSELLTTLRLESISLAEAKELAKGILRSQKYANRSLAELLSAIYGSTIKREELE